MGCKPTPPRIFLIAKLFSSGIEPVTMDWEGTGYGVAERIAELFSSGVEPVTINP